MSNRRPALRPKCLYPYPSRVHAPVLRPATKWYEAVAARSKYSWTALPYTNIISVYAIPLSKS